MANADAITVACLHGAAGRLLSRQIPHDEAVAQLRAITRRPDLLALAAGTAVGAWRHSSITSWQGQAIAQLPLEAGADPDMVEERAAVVVERLQICNVTGGTPQDLA